MLDTGCWILVAGYWMLVAGCWILVAGYWILVAGYWILVAGHWLLDPGFFLLDTGYWIKDTIQSKVDFSPFLLALSDTGQVDKQLPSGIYFPFIFTLFHIPLYLYTSIPLYLYTLIPYTFIPFFLSPSRPSTPPARCRETCQMDRSPE